MNLILDNIFIINLLYITIKFGKKKTRAERYVDDNGVRTKKKKTLGNIDEAFHSRIVGAIVP